MISSLAQEKSLGVVELESCIKATKTMAVMRKYKEASEFLQNAVYINLKVPDNERVARYVLEQKVRTFKKHCKTGS